jgi:hypothetical protein
MSSVAATLEVDPPASGGDSYTNLDVITGKVHVTLKSETSVKSIVVKLEGIARTMVPIPEDREATHHDGHERRRRRRRDRDSKNLSVEIHKVLYRQSTLFPPKEVARSSTSNQFTLPAGSYTYNFSFKIPVNVECVQADAASRNAAAIPGMPKFLISKTGIDIAKPPQSHVDGILPPSLSGLGDAASVKYFVKVTINRASMLKMNTRTYYPFVFLPMDPPRLYDSTKMAFVRRQLTVGVSNGSGKKSNGFFSKLMGVNTWPGGTLTFTFEARFPSSGTFVPLAPLPMELYAIFPDHPLELVPEGKMYIGGVSVVLYAKTVAKAHEYHVDHPLKLRLCNRESISIELGLEKAVKTTRNGQSVWELKMPSAVLDGIQIPDYVCPSFDTCNIARSYSIEVVVGFFCVSGTPTDHVSVLTDIILRSGVSPPGTTTNGQTFNRPIPTPLEKAGGGAEASGKGGSLTSEGQEMGPNDSLPTYDDVVSAGPSAATQAVNVQPRRKFGQSKDYYSDFDDE